MTGDDTADVLAANRAFYAAFTDRDLARMDALWAQRADVVCVHPGAPPLLTRDAVMESWHAILTTPGSPQIDGRDASAVLLGDTALVTCTEVIAAASIFATNGFVRQDGVWRMVLHHASPALRRKVRKSDTPADTPTGTPTVH